MTHPPHSRRLCACGLALASLALLLGGCRGAQPRSGDPSQRDRLSRLAARADTLWKARAAEDWSVVFDFRDPRKRKEEDRAKFVDWCKQNEFIYKAHTIGRSQTDGPYGWVEVDSTKGHRRFPQAPAQHVEYWEPWRWVENDWYPVPPDELRIYPAAPAERIPAEEQKLAARFELAWQARRTRNHEALHALIDPDDREQVTLEVLSSEEAKTEALSRAVEFCEVRKPGDRGRVLVAYSVKLTDPNLSKKPPDDVVVIEQWVKRDGEWYRDMLQAPGKP